jgi:anti-sigma factor RsiW
MNCRDRELSLGAYVDGELDLGASLELESHLATCSACTTRIEELRRLTRTIRTRASHFAPSRELIDTLRSSLRSPIPRIAPAPTTFVRRPSIAAMLLVAAAVLVAWIGGVWWARPSSEVLVAEAVVAAHIRSLQAEHLTDVASSDRHTVNPWFQGKLDFAVKAEDYADRGFALAGGRLEYIDGSTAAALVYRHGKHVLNVFEWPMNPDLNAEPSLITVRGYSAQHWNSGGMSVWVVSDADLSTLTELTGLLRRAGS